MFCTLLRHGERLVMGVLLALCLEGLAMASEPFQVSSSTFRDGTLMPRKVGNNLAQNANCVGQNVSPELTWKNAPEGTRSFALTVIDPEGRAGLGVVHWVAYGIPASVSGFKEGEASSDSNKFVGGESTFKVGHYSGPCTPPGPPHHYIFTVIATDLDPKELPAALTLNDLQQRLTGHAKAAASMVGLFRHPD